MRCGPRAAFNGPMSRYRGLGACSAAFLALALAAPALAGAAPITGELDRPGYTVIALAASGEARTVIAQDGGFSVEPPAATVSLHLRAPDGTYAGPVVLEDTTDRVAQARRKVRRATKKLKQANRVVRRARRAAARATGEQAKTKAAKRLKKARQSLRKAKKQLKKAKRRLRDARARVALKPHIAVVGVKAGAALGRVAVNSAGFALARLGTRAWDTGVDPRRAAQATNGVPIGAGNVGLVRSTRTGGAGIGDTDLDAVPQPLDVDDDGDLVFDGFDSSLGSPSARAAAVTDAFLPSANLVRDLANTANANAAGLTDQQAETALSTQGVLMLGIIPGDSAELDCGGTRNPSPPPALVGGLSYCSSGGTGQAWVVTGEPPPSQIVYQPFPDCCDSDADGFGTMLASNPQPAPGSGQYVMFLTHGATTSQIATGDVLIQRVTRAGAETAYPATVPYVFATVPALASFSDGQSAPVTMSYPVASNGVGTRGNPFPVAADSGGDVALTLTFWRPQRRPLPGEPGYSDPPSAWTDMGGLNHGAGVTETGAMCSQSNFSTTDPNLRPLTMEDRFGANYPGFRDLAPNQPASAANTLTYTLEITGCLEANGMGGLFDEPGEDVAVTLNALVPRGGGTQQALFFERK